MRFLLDTHAFLWATGQSKKLPPTVSAAITDVSNDIFVSAVSFMEIAIKVRSGRLDIGEPAAGDLPERALDMGFALIALSPSEAASMGSLAEDTHFDPFDRILIWQAIQRDLTLVSLDPEFAKFKKDGLKLFWK